MSSHGLHTTQMQRYSPTEYAEFTEPSAEIFSHGLHRYTQMVRLRKINNGLSGLNGFVGCVESNGCIFQGGTCLKCTNRARNGLKRILRIHPFNPRLNSYSKKIRLIRLIRC